MPRGGGGRSGGVPLSVPKELNFDLCSELCQFRKDCAAVIYQEEVAENESSDGTIKNVGSKEKKSTLARSKPQETSATSSTGTAVCQLLNALSPVSCLRPVSRVVFSRTTSEDPVSSALKSGSSLPLSSTSLSFTTLAVKGATFALCGPALQSQIQRTIAHADELRAKLASASGDAVSTSRLAALVEQADTRATALIKLRQRLSESSTAGQGQNREEATVNLREGLGGASEAKTRGQGEVHGAEDTREAMEKEKDMGTSSGSSAETAEQAAVGRKGAFLQSFPSDIKMWRSTVGVALSADCPAFLWTGLYAGGGCARPLLIHRETYRRNAYFAERAGQKQSELVAQGGRAAPQDTPVLDALNQDLKSEEGQQQGKEGGGEGGKESAEGVGGGAEKGGEDAANVVREVGKSADGTGATGGAQAAAPKKPAKTTKPQRKKAPVKKANVAKRFKKEKKKKKKKKAKPAASFLSLCEEGCEHGGAELHPEGAESFSSGTFSASTAALSWAASERALDKQEEGQFSTEAEVAAFVQLHDKVETALKKPVQKKSAGLGATASDPSWIEVAAPSRGMQPEQQEEEGEASPGAASPRSDSRSAEQVAKKGEEEVPNRVEAGVSTAADSDGQRSRQTAVHAGSAKASQDTAEENITTQSTHTESGGLDAGPQKSRSTLPDKDTVRPPAEREKEPLGDAISAGRGVPLDVSQEEGTFVPGESKGQASAKEEHRASPENEEGSSTQKDGQSLRVSDPSVSGAQHHGVVQETGPRGGPETSEGGRMFNTSSKEHAGDEASSERVAGSRQEPSENEKTTSLSPASSAEDDASTSRSTSGVEQSLVARPDDYARRDAPPGEVSGLRNYEKSDGWRHCYSLLMTRVGRQYRRAAAREEGERGGAGLTEERKAEENDQANKDNRINEVIAEAEKAVGTQNGREKERAEVSRLKELGLMYQRGEGLVFASFDLTHAECSIYVLDLPQPSSLSSPSLSELFPSACVTYSPDSLLLLPPPVAPSVAQLLWQSSTTVEDVLKSPSSGEAAEAAAALGRLPPYSCASSCVLTPWSEWSRCRDDKEEEPAKLFSEDEESVGGNTNSYAGAQWQVRVRGVEKAPFFGDTCPEQAELKICEGSATATNLERAVVESPEHVDLETQRDGLREMAVTGGAGKVGDEDAQMEAFRTKRLEAVERQLEQVDAAQVDRVRAQLRAFLEGVKQHVSVDCVLGPFSPWTECKCPVDELRTRLRKSRRRRPAFFRASFLAKEVAADGAGDTGQAEEKKGETAEKKIMGVRVRSRPVLQNEVTGRGLGCSRAAVEEKETCDATTACTEQAAQAVRRSREEQKRRRRRLKSFSRTSVSRTQEETVLHKISVGGKNQSVRNAAMGDGKEAKETKGQLSNAGLRQEEASAEAVTFAPTAGLGVSGTSFNIDSIATSSDGGPNSESEQQMAGSLTLPASSGEGTSLTSPPGGLSRSSDASPVKDQVDSGGSPAVTASQLQYRSEREIRAHLRGPNGAEVDVGAAAAAAKLPKGLSSLETKGEEVGEGGTDAFGTGSIEPAGEQIGVVAFGLVAVSGVLLACTLVFLLIGCSKKVRRLLAVGDGAPVAPAKEEEDLSEKLLSVQSVRWPLTGLFALVSPDGNQVYDVQGQQLIVTSCLSSGAPGSPPRGTPLSTSVGERIFRTREGNLVGEWGESLPVEVLPMELRPGYIPLPTAGSAAFAQAAAPKAKASAPALKQPPPPPPPVRQESQAAPAGLSAPEKSPPPAKRPFGRVMASPRDLAPPTEAPQKRLSRAESAAALGEVPAGGRKFSLKGRKSSRDSSPSARGRGDSSEHRESPKKSASGDGSRERKKTDRSSGKEGRTSKWSSRHNLKRKNKDEAKA